MVKVRCHTNLDVREEWPTELPCRPHEGDLIQSKSGLELQVCRVSFVHQERALDQSSFPHHYWEVYVELHLPPSRFRCISHFELWYNEIHCHKDKQGNVPDWYRESYQQLYKKYCDEWPGFGS